MQEFEVRGQIVNLKGYSVTPGMVTIADGRIKDITFTEQAPPQYLVPGFIDAHVHIESSMLVPSEFARLAVVHGTVATVSDPHEIANVLGVPGVHFMVENASQTNFKCYFGAPSCVPATSFETAGALIDSNQIASLLEDPHIHYLAEMMNWPGVLQGDEEVMTKIRLAHHCQKPVDGHAPGLRGVQAKNYAKAGISTDHECFTLEEALEKLEYGMKIIIREGSAAKNFEALIGLLPQHKDQVMFCSDDKHPDNLVEGHINILLKRGVAKGIDPLVMLQAACKNPVDHYHLDVGQLQLGDPADLLVIKDLQEFEVLETYINGELVAANGRTNLSSKSLQVVNQFNTPMKSSQDFRIPAKGDSIKVIVAEDGQLITKMELHPAKIEKGLAISDTSNDLLKISVVNRYHDASPALGFVKNFGLKEGAIASSVAHDSHNIIAVGVDDEHICTAVNAIIEAQGGVAVANKNEVTVLPLPVAGLMSAADGYQVAHKYTELDTLAKSLGSTLQAPFMTLSFMALLVIPEIKLSDRGLFDGVNFEFIDLFANG